MYKVVSQGRIQAVAALSPAGIISAGMDVIIRAAYGKIIFITDMVRHFGPEERFLNH